MTLDRKLASLEAESDATERVARWLDEAHAFGRFDAYALHLHDADPRMRPLDRLPREAIAAVRAKRGLAPDARETAIRAAIRQVVFRVHLIIRIMEAADSTLRREGMLQALFMAYVCLAIETKDEPQRSVVPLTHARDLLFVRADALQRQEEARTIVEQRYLVGHPALFPDAQATWAEQLHEARKAAVMADRLCELDGLPPVVVPTEMDQEALQGDIDDLVEAARIKTLDDVGEGGAAIARANRWLRPKLGSISASERA